MKVGDIPEVEWAARWPHVRLDEFNSLPEMEVGVMNALNTLCYDAECTLSWRHRINDDYRATGDGQHRIGNAVDVVFYLQSPGDVGVLDQFLFALGRSTFRRVGFYPFWNAPGLHLDMKNETLYWWRDKSLTYHYGRTPGKLLTWV